MMAFSNPQLPPLSYLVPTLADDEAERLEALRGFDILDTPPEASFDGITQTAAEVCKVPIALVSLVDHDRQWFKSSYGLDAAQTPRCVSFCGHAILSDATFIVPDAHADPRFAANPLVLGEPKARFYAGAPLVTADGYCVGTLCVIDSVPRVLSAQQREVLGILAQQVVALMEMRVFNSRLQELQSMLQVQTRELEHKNRTLDELSFANAHELREQLRTISNYSQLLARYGSDQLNEDGQRYTNYILVAASRMQSLLDHLQALAQFNDQGDTFHTVDLCDVIDEAKSRAEDGPVAAEALVVAKDLPAISADRDLLVLLFENLFSNAIKFRSNDDLRVEVTAAQDKDEWVFAIRDNGIGFDETYAERIFKMFERLHGRDGERAGSGIGLALCDRIVRSHGGRMWAKSTPGDGTTIYFSIPERLMRSRVDQPARCDL